MKISNKTDVCSFVPDGEKGTNFFDNPGLKPSKGNIPDSPGEKASNDPAAFSQNKKQPYGKGGSGIGGY